MTKDLIIVFACVFAAIVLIVHELVRDDNMPEPDAGEGEELLDERE